MSTDTVAAPPAKKPAGYKMPAAQVGDLVLWYPDGNTNEQPAPALVTHVGDRTLAVAVIVKDAYGFNPQDGVRHVSDPSLRLAENRPSGAWDYTPQSKELNQLRQALRELMERKPKS